MLTITTQTGPQDGKAYRVTNTGTWYHQDTPDAVIEALESARINHTRILLDLGDTTTGESWHEEHDITGYVSRSMGPIKIPILLYNAQSLGGGGILTHCILSIRTTKKPYRTLYQWQREAKN